MKLIRSWPLHVPTARNHVVDDAPRLINDRYSYRGLVELDDDVIQLDWDTAVSREDLASFAAAARRRPANVLVAPVRIYPDGRKGLARPIWNLRNYEHNTRGEEIGLREVGDGEATCDLFGFGMVYLPRAVLAEFEQRWRAQLDTGDVRFDDTGLAGWHYRERGPTRIAWDVRPIHLHYRIADVLGD